jgi:hypothetical protein
VAKKQQLIDLQNRIVHGMAEAVSEPWDFFVVNYEREEIDGERTQDTLAISFANEKGTWKRSSFEPPYDCCCLLSRLSELMSSKGGETWGSCTLEVDSSGKYRFSYSYEPPKRLNGILDDESLLKGYTPRPW